MANTYTISLPDDVKEYADELAGERKLSEVITEDLRKRQKQRGQRDTKR